MNYSSSDIFQGIRYAAFSIEDADLQGKTKKQKDLAILLEGLKKTYENAVQDLHYDENKFSNQTSQLEENFKATQNFFQTSKALLQNQTVASLVQDHDTLISQALSLYQQGQEVISLPQGDQSQLKVLLPQMQQATDHLINHVNQLGNQLNAVITSNGSADDSQSISNADVFTAILLLTTSSYKMTSALGALQARISTSLNALLGLLNNLQALMSKLNQFYQAAMVTIAKYAHDPNKGASPPSIEWGTGYYGVSWDDIVKNTSGVTSNGIVFSASDVADNPLITIFGTPSTDGQYTINPNFQGTDQFGETIRYMSQQLSGLMPNDSDTPDGSFYTNNKDSAKSSQNTTSFLQAVGKQTEMLQNKLSAVANSVNLCQQGNAQILNIFQQILSLQSSLMSKL